MFKKGNNIFSLLIIILSVFMTSSINIVKAADSGTGPNWGDSLITKGQLQDLKGNPLTEFNQNQSMRAYWEFSNKKNGVNQELHKDDTMVVKVPEQLALTTSNTDDINIYANGTSTSIGIAHLDPSTRTITVTFNQNADDLSKNSASLQGSFWINKISWNTQMDLSKEINLVWTTDGSAASNPDTTGTVTVKPSVPDSSEVLYKYGGFDKDNIIHWTVRINYAGQTIPNAAYKDIIGPNQKLLPDTIVAHHANFDKTTGQITEDKDPFTVRPVVNSTSNPTEFTINFGKINQSIMLYYDTQTTDDSKSSYYGNTGDLLSNSKVIENVPVNLSTNQLGGQATNNGAVTSIRGYKLWNIPDTMTMPETITIDLFQGTATDPYQTATVSKDKTTGDWYYEFNNLPKYDDNGKEINYDVKEDAKEAAALGFTGVRDPTNYNITNIPTPDKTVFKVKKEWNDNNNAANKRPKSITVGLFNGAGQAPANYDNKATLTSNEVPAKNWTAEFTNLPSTGIDDPNWYVSEDSIPNYVHTSDSYNYNNPYDKVITNTLATSLTVTKKWVDSNGNATTTNTSPIQVQLYQNDKAKNNGNDTPIGNPITLDNANHWTDTFEINEPTDSSSNPAQTTKLPVYDNDGNKITYHAEEVADSIPTGYSSKPDYSTTTNADGTETTITNKQIDTTKPTDDKTTFTVNKVWAGDDNNSNNTRPKSVQVQLYAGNDKSGDPVSLEGKNSWTYTWNNLAKNDDTGKEITYSAQEVSDPNTKYTYTPSYINDKTTGTITNTLKTSGGGNTGESTKQLNVTKTWSDNNNQDNLRPNHVTVHLLKNGAEVDSAVLNADNNWNHNFTGLDKTATYTISEDKVADYTTNIDSTDANNVQIINTHTPKTTTTTDDKTNLTVKKSWNDQNNQDKLRPNQVTIHLLKNGTIIGQPITLSSLNAWSYTWNDLDKNGKYTVQEDNVPDYNSSQNVVDGVITITNTHNVTKTPGNPGTPTIPGGNTDTPGGSLTGNNGGNGDQTNTGNGGGSDTTTDYTPANPMVPSPIYQNNDSKNSLLPQTGSKDANIIYSILGFLILGFIAIFTIKRKQV